MIAASASIAAAAAPAGRVPGVLAGLELAVRAVLGLGVPGGTIAAAAGIFALTLAARNPRALSVAGGAAVGALAALAAAAALRPHLDAGPAPAAAVGAIAGAAAGAWAPSFFPFAAGALPGALLGASFPLAGRAFLGAAAGALGMGVVAYLWAREVSAAFASLAGALLLGMGLLAAFGSQPLARELAGRPFALLAFATVVGVAGTALQTSGREAGPPLRGSRRAAEDERP